MITITGAAGSIGSALAARLNAEGFRDLVLVDDFESRPDKARNHADRTCVERVNRRDFSRWLQENEAQVQFVFHLGPSPRQIHDAKGSLIDAKPP